MSMLNGRILCIPRSEAIRRAGAYLTTMGFQVSEKAAQDTSYLLLPVPSFPAGDQWLAHILADLPENVIVSGGNLTSPLLKDYATVDFLQDPYDLAENAAITADCAFQIVESKLKVQTGSRKVLIIGWGRIGKCLCKLFDENGFAVTVAARKDADRAMIRALGYRGISIGDAAREAKNYDVILNTVPVMVLPNLDAREDAVILELASKPGMSGKNILECRGLPGKMSPEQSGKLIAQTFLRLVFGMEV